LLNFKTEWNAKQTEPNLPIPPGPRSAQREFSPGQAHRHALDRVRVQLDCGSQEISLGFDKKVPAPNEKAFGIERLSPRRGELILGRLVE
jgi:hypothetical protein